MIDLNHDTNLGGQHEQTSQLLRCYEFIDCPEFAKRMNLPESWVRDAVRHRSGDPLPHVRFGKYVRFRWGSAELEIHEDGSDVVLKGTQVYADAVNRGYKCVYSAERFFGPEKHYLKSEKDWVISDSSKPAEPKREPVNPCDIVRRQRIELQMKGGLSQKEAEEFVDNPPWARTGASR